MKNGGSFHSFLYVYQRVSHCEINSSSFWCCTAIVNLTCCPQFSQYQSPQKQNTYCHHTWRFPKIGVPPNHPILVGYSIVNQPAIGDPPSMEDSKSYQKSQQALNDRLSACQIHCCGINVTSSREQLPSGHSSNLRSSKRKHTYSLQDRAPKIAKLRYKWFDSGLW